MIKNERGFLKLSYITIFPEYFESYFKFSIQNRAKKNGFLEVEIYNIREYAKNKKVDDYQYGGGRGMVMKIEPVVKIINIINENEFVKKPYFILLNPQAKIFKQPDVKRLLSKENLVFICGHYEGIDNRIKNFVNEEISIGEFITMGGEIPSIVISESLIRSIPGLINNDSLENETFSKTKTAFDYDCYTRPESFKGFKVPEVLLSGNHQEIQKWRKNNSLCKEKLEIFSKKDEKN